MQMGVCPVCDGTKMVPLTETEKNYSWYKDRTHRECQNCGAQRMFSVATGKVPLRPDGTPCTHSYKSETIGRCYTRYTCEHCGDKYEIDSGD